MCMYVCICVLTLGFQSKSLLAEAASLPHSACHEGNAFIYCVYVGVRGWGCGCWTGRARLDLVRMESSVY